jgi:hypothetical protein
VTEVKIYIRRANSDSFEDPIVLDAATAIGHARDSEITRHPVESGAPATDHIIPQPESLTVSGVISNTPVTTAQQRRIDSFANFAAGNPEVAQSYYQHAFERLHALHQQPRLCKIVTEEFVYDDMAMKALSMPRDATTGEALALTVTFEAINLVKTRTAQVEAKYLRSQNKRNLGNKPSTDVAEENATAEHPEPEKPAQSSLNKLIYDDGGKTPVEKLFGF